MKPYPKPRKITWTILKIYGSIAYKLNQNQAYYWALRAMCNHCHLDWYKKPCHKIFNKI